MFHNYRSLTSFATATVIVSAFVCSLASAQEPVGIVSIRSVNGIVEELKPSFTRAGAEDTFLQMTGMLEGASGAVDLNKPAGAVIVMQANGTPGGMAFAGLVVDENGDNSFDGLIALLKFGLGEPTEHPGGIFEFATGGGDAGGDPGFPDMPPADGGDPFGKMRRFNKDADSHFVAFGDDPFGAPASDDVEGDDPFGAPAGGDEFGGDEFGGDEFGGGPGGDPLAAMAPSAIFLGQKNNVVYVSGNKEMLAALPDDPQTLVKGLAAKQDIAIEFLPKKLPAEMQQMAKDFLVSAMEDADPADSGVDPEQLKIWLDALEKLSVTINVDGTTGKLMLGTGIEVSPGSEPATWFGELKNTKTMLAGIRELPNPGMRTVATSPLRPETAEAFIKFIEEGPTVEPGEDPTRKSSHRYKDMVVTIAKQVVASETFDAGMAVVADEKSRAAVIGAVVDDSEGLVESFRKLYAQIKADDQLEIVGKPEITFHKSGDKNFRFVLLNVKVKGDSPEDIARFGDTSQVLMARGEEVFFIIFGTGADTTTMAKSIIDTSVEKAGMPVTPFEFSLSLNQMEKVTPEVADPNAEQIRSSIEKFGDEDRIQIDFVLNEAGNGGIYQLTLDRWALDMAAEFAGNMMSGGGPPPGVEPFPGDGPAVPGGDPFDAPSDVPSDDPFGAPAKDDTPAEDDPFGV